MSTVILKLRSRPLRVVSLARSREEILLFVRLNTHLSGGMANYILPFPTDEQLVLFEKQLQKADPDVVFFLEGSIGEGSPLEVALKNFPAMRYPVSENAVVEHIEGPNPLTIRSLSLPHVGPIFFRLYPTRFQESTFCWTEECERYSFIQALQQGLPSERMQKYLHSHFKATILRKPTTVQELLKTQLVTADKTTPLTATGLNGSWHVKAFVDMETVSLFLDDGQSIASIIAYWNELRSGNEGKFLLPRLEFLENVESCLTTLLEAIPSMHGIHVYTSVTQEGAKALEKRITQVLRAIGKPMPVLVIHQGHEFRICPEQFYSTAELTITRNMISDRSIRFQPQPPPGYTDRKIAYGFDALVELEQGGDLSLGVDAIMATLLNNDSERLQRALEDSSNAQFILRPHYIRPSAEGISGIASIGEESRFYTHTDDHIISTHISASGYTIRSNKHTRYAKGFIKRFDSVGKALSVIGKGGADIITALHYDRAKENGLVFAQIVQFLKNRRERPKAQQEVAGVLPVLLARGVVRRGVAILCDQCGLEDWYPVDQLKEIMRCNGCAEEMQLQAHKMDFRYKNNELAARFIESGGHAVLATARALSHIDPTAQLLFGGDIHQRDSRTPVAECDLLWLSGKYLALVECKAYQYVSEHNVEEFRKSLCIKIDTLVENLGAKLVILGVVAGTFPQSLFTMTQELSNSAANKGVRVHLILNGKVHIDGSVEGKEALDVRKHKIVPDETASIPILSVGASVNTFYGRAEDILDEDVIDGWLGALRVDSK